MNIITGYRGEPHVTSGQDRDGNQGSYGTGSYILDVGDKMAASIVSANEIRISDGILSHQGCLGNIEKGLYESLSIDNGAQGMKRSDLIVCRYEKDIETNVESLSLIVIKGTPAETNPADPTYVTGDIQTGDSPVDFPLYRVNINGVNVASVTRLAAFVKTQDELGATLGSMVIMKTYNATYSVAANGYVTLTGDDFNLSTPAGYSALAMLNFNSGSSACIATLVQHASGTGQAMVLRNVTGSAVNNRTAIVRYAYILSSTITS